MPAVYMNYSLHGYKAEIDSRRQTAAGSNRNENATGENNNSPVAFQFSSLLPAVCLLLSTSISAPLVKSARGDWVRGPRCKSASDNVRRFDVASGAFACLADAIRQVPLPP